MIIEQELANSFGASQGCGVGGEISDSDFAKFPTPGSNLLNFQL